MRAPFPFGGEEGVLELAEVHDHGSVTAMLPDKNSCIRLFRGSL
jgi:hypothetical protein